jgi:nucleotidyltransferase substrate binding protein (TIGR01987 family)
MQSDIRWQQRFSNYVKALNKLTEAVRYVTDDKNLSYGVSAGIIPDIIKEGLIQRFEYTHELAWNTMKDYADYQGNSSIGGSRDATREAFQLKLIDDGYVWMDMINSRNKTSHTYDEKVADDIYNRIVSEYYPAFIRFKTVMEYKKECQISD